MDNLTAGNPVAHRVRVHFISTSTVLYEGMPVCYNYDSTSNWWGGSVSDGAVTAAATLADGNQNPAKYMEVETPSATNLQWFAGVVAKGGWCGKTTSATSGVGQILDIYVPNGAIVPVRVGLSTTAGFTVLAVANALAYFTNPTTVWATGVCCRSAAIAEDTVTGTAGAPVLCLSRLAPDVFLHQGTSHDVWNGTNVNQLLVGAGESDGVLIANSISLKSTQTGGDFVAMKVTAEMGGTGGRFGSGAFYVNTIFSAVPLANQWHIGIRSDFTVKSGITLGIGKYMAGLFKVENQETTPSDVTSSRLHSIGLEIAATTSEPAQLSYIYVNNSGDQSLDAVIACDQAASALMTAAASVTVSHKIPILMVGGVVYYVAIGTTTG